MQTLSRVHNAVFAQPWAIMPEWLDTICAVLQRHQNDDTAAIQASIEAAVKIGQARSANLYSDEYEIVDGVAMLKLIGPIFPRANLMTAMSGATSLEMFSRKFAAAQANKDVKAMLIQIDSPGGSAIGIDVAAQRVFDARSMTKPVVAIADGIAASAAYWIGSQADWFYATDAAIVGSIGVVTQVVDYSRQEANEGLDVTTIKTGPLKAIGSGKVTSEQIDHLREINSEIFDMFKAAVSRARPTLRIDDVATGAVWVGRTAVQHGLVDGVSTVEKLLADLAT